VARGPLFVSVGGGKGGIGKSVVAANLAIAISELGLRTTLVDADLGAANQHTLFGIDRPGISLQALLDKEVDHLTEVGIPTGAPRLSLIPGIGAIPGAANLHHAQKLKILRQLSTLEAEVVVIDVGAGVSFNVLDFFEIGDTRLVVTSPQLPAMQNAYCFLKAVVHRSLKKRLQNSQQKELLAEVLQRSETERIRDLRARARQAGAELDLAFQQVLSGLEARIVGNMVERPGQRKVFDALSRMSRDFLDAEVPVAALLGLRREIHDSVTRRRPFLLDHPTHAEAATLRSLARQAVDVDVESIRRRRITENPPAASGAPSSTPVPEDQARWGVPLIAYLRAEDREAVSHPVEVERRRGLHTARMEDISPRGVRLVGEGLGEVGERIEMSLVGFSERPRLRGHIRHISVSGREAGVELTPESRPVAEWLLHPKVPRRTETPRSVSAIAS
jgi:flagellar biosynthesis protein FlhG